MRLLNNIYEQISGIKKVKSSKFTDKFYLHDFSKGKRSRNVAPNLRIELSMLQKMNKKSRHKEVACCLFACIDECALNFRLKYAKKATTSLTQICRRYRKFEPSAQKITRLTGLCFHTASQSKICANFAAVFIFRPLASSLVCAYRPRRPADRRCLCLALCQ